MPAMLDDPTAPAIYRISGEAPYPLPYGPLPPDIAPKQVILRDRVTTATLVPFSSPAQVPPRLTAYLCELLGREIEKGDTYPMVEPMPQASFGPYWFANFGAVMVVGDIQSPEEVSEMEARGADWSRECLGSFYIKPNYPGRSSHVCNGGFLVTDAARNRGVGRLMGEGYLDWAPKLGYSYSVFNLVYETNVASLRIWDALGFKRIGRVKGCGNLKSYPDQLIDAIIFGRELGGEGDEMVSEERFDKIRYYLKNGTYPNGSDRAEKSRLRSAATHYRLIPAENEDEEDRLMLKGKEVVSDPNKQYEIARDVHLIGHGGINKTTATIAEKYHWVRIKETVSAAIRNCPECKDTNAPKPPSAAAPRRSARENSNNGGNGNDTKTRSTPRMVAAGTSPEPSPARAGASPEPQPSMSHQQQMQPPHHQIPVAQMHYQQYPDLPVDPQLMAGMQSWEAQRMQSWEAQHMHPHGLPTHMQHGDSMQMHGAELGGLEKMEDDRALREELEAQLGRPGVGNEYGRRE